MEDTAYWHNVLFDKEGSQNNNVLTSGSNELKICEEEEEEEIREDDETDNDEDDSNGGSEARTVGTR